MEDAFVVEVEFEMVPEVGAGRVQQLMKLKSKQLGDNISPSKRTKQGSILICQCYRASFGLFPCPFGFAAR